MSQFGTVIDALETLARAQWPGLRSGVAGFERSLRPIELLTDAELPHVFAHNPEERTEPIEYGQERAEFSVELLYAPVAGTSQESLAVLMDLFRSAVQGDPTLGGVCERAYVRERGVREHPEREQKVGFVEVVAERTS